MSENRFTVPAKKPPVKKKEEGQKKAKTSAEKLEKAKVKKTGSQKLAPKSLPDVPDLGNMTRDERIGKVLGLDKKPPQKKSGEKKASGGRYSQIRESLEKQEKTKKSVKKAPEIPLKAQRDWSAIAIRIALVLLVAILVAILLVVRTRRQSTEVEEVVAPATQATVVVEAGMGAREVAYLFSDYVEPEELLGVLEESGKLSSIQVGTYTVTPSVDVHTLADMITTREEGTVTVYSGYTIDDIDRMLANRLLTGRGDFIQAAQDLASSCGLDFAEGWLLSGVYTWTDAATLARDALHATLSVFMANAQALASSGLSARDAVILASMINRETQDASQMPTIAAVMLNRLEAGMPLGIDATTRYELGRWTGEVSQAEYDRITPYNTRRKTGLPPSGIGCPSAEAILAVLHPSDTQALYYLHDDEGQIHTSMTYEEHLETYERVH